MFPEARNLSAYSIFISIASDGTGAFRSSKAYRRKHRFGAAV
ncbi:hypothetical protein CHCC20488_2783 [Bacillus paralicheniformis]|nr:hypothetical protein CHCC5019_3577 [Bacillus paralicheniformis]TWL19522.1 hypothetical protein CHCC19467_2858 [Bacillus paralicheniformis]TWL35572.1 hypothetical protein CHCC15337_0395 [Bacillus paralicheniformis]TWL47838.1 hypothetical protein CHCC15332_2024 [Bacillus paralicheniformis]TWN77178.1 hypothetical protein CHCC14427_2936 [Bacillus paralicheniformis]